MQRIHAYVLEGTEITTEFLNNIKDAIPGFQPGDKIIVHMGKTELVYLYAEFAKPPRPWIGYYGDPANTTAKSYPKFSTETLQEMAERMTEAARPTYKRGDYFIVTAADNSKHVCRLACIAPNEMILISSERANRWTNSFHVQDMCAVTETEMLHLTNGCLYELL